jgi:hypothetical protein
MTDKTYDIRIVCDDMDTPIDWSLFNFRIPEAYLSKAEEIEKLIRWIIAHFGDRLKKSRIGETLIGWYEELGSLVEDIL